MNSQQFITALRKLEDENDVEPLVSLYADDAVLCNPELERPMHGRDGARRFWRGYRDTFRDIHSEFRVVVDGQSSAALEWVSGGTLAAGDQPIEYPGVSVLEWRDDRITRFAAYFDPQALRVEHPHPVEPSEESATERAARREAA